MLVVGPNDGFTPESHGVTGDNAGYNSSFHLIVHFGNACRSLATPISVTFVWLSSSFSSCGTPSRLRNPSSVTLVPLRRIVLMQGNALRCCNPESVTFVRSRLKSFNSGNALRDGRHHRKSACC